MSRILTAAQIRQQFESEWVLVEDPETNDALEVESGKVRWHSKDRDEVYRKAVELRLKRFAMLYTGEMPEGTAIVLYTNRVSVLNSGSVGAQACSLGRQPTLLYTSRWARRLACQAEAEKTPWKGEI
jgi:hypothetical protein